MSERHFYPQLRNNFLDRKLASTQEPKMWREPRVIIL